MDVIYALAVTICLRDGQCVTTTPEVYDDLTRCVMEVSNQRKGMFKETPDKVWCMEYKEDGNNLLLASNPG